MAARSGLELRQGQSQSLVMTPQLQQSIKLLQMSGMELMEFLEQQMLENPLLQAAEPEQGSGGESLTDETPVENIASRSTSDDADSSNWQDNHDFNDKDAELDVDDSSNWKEAASAGDAEQSGYWEMTAESGGTRHSGDSLSPGEIVEQTVANAISLQEHVRQQVAHEGLPPSQQFIVDYLIDLLDEAGYMHEPLPHIAEALGCSTDDVEAALTQIQQCDPVGIGARSLQECLALQLKDKNRFDPAMAKLVQYLDLIAEGAMARLQRICGVSDEDLKDMLQELRALNPKPGFLFDHSSVDVVQPDITVQLDNKGQWQVELTPHSLPRLLVNQHYYSQLKDHTHKEAEKKFLSEKLQHANWLTKALDQRAHTILRVATEIVSQQSMFLKHGVRYLKPLTLKAVAEQLDLHESTVSRVTANKYMETPRGVFELKYFFTSALSYDGMGGELSSEAVKSQIRDLIESETADAILSDDAIADILQERGISIARRTVAKYREAMRLGSSAERRREKKRMQKNSA